MRVGTLAIADALAVQASNAVTRIDILFIGILQAVGIDARGRIEGMVLCSDRQRPLSSRNLPETVAGVGLRTLKTSRRSTSLTRILASFS
jgi:hypothetical protein